MKNTTLRYTGLFVTLATTLLFLANSSGPASNNNFYTGAPSVGGGTEFTCNLCHNSGAGDYGEPQVSWNISATDGGTNITQYTPGQTYFVTVTVSEPMGAPAAYGFQSVFLDDPAMGIPQNAGTLVNPDINTQFFSTAERTYVEHNSRNATGEWKFQWTAPTPGVGNIKIYSVGNLVNGIQGPAGDSGSSAPTVITLLDVSLPVSLADLSARADKQKVYLNWQTALEEQVDRFEVEHSRDGVDFRRLAEVAAVGESDQLQTYNFTDVSAEAGENYYRLRMVDTDGSFAYSPLVVARLEDKIGQLRVFPNPASNRVSLELPPLADGQLRLLNNRGQAVYTGPPADELDLSPYPAGLYLIEVLNGEERFVQRLLKQ